jgi:hypothetical protein
MKTFARSILYIGALAIGTNGLMAAQGTEQWYKAKFGRNSPREEARQRAERENAASKQEITVEVAPPAILAPGTGALLLSKHDLKPFIANAKTVQDHGRLAQHFDARANQLEAEANEHQELAAQYKANPTTHESKHPMSGETAGHCQYFADDLQKAAQRARQLATDHREMATPAPK